MGWNVSKCHGLMVRAIFATRRQTGSDDRRPKPFLMCEDKMGGRKLADYGVHRDVKRGRGRRLIDTILYTRCSTASQPTARC